MIHSSFCFLPGIGATSERRLWRQGLLTWSEFLSRPSIDRIGRVRKAVYDNHIAKAMEQYAGDNARYFGVVFPSREHWRLYEWLRPGAVYLDIETDSVGRITVVGLYGRERMTSFVRGESLSTRRLSEELRHYDLLVTFCGTTFDLPMLLSQFPDLPLDQPHVDLCLLGRRLGYRGGLKAIEKQLCVHRTEELEGMGGDAATRCWNRWRYGRDEEARGRLLDYNEADCVNLQPLGDIFYRLMVQSTKPSSTA
ncbi:MAG TPA: ribonuclease H-like domain-containing protein [Nitrospira sp.]|nr:ribonuclease H-like domain-containing protein [Nitrospira sp.]